MNTRQENNVTHLEGLFKGCRTDPWGIDWRGSQKLRREMTVSAIRKASVKFGTPRTMLDIGCSTGDLTVDIVSKIQIASALGLDVSTEAAQIASGRFCNVPGLIFTAGDFLDGNGPWNNQFDLVLCSLVFPYLDDEGINSYLTKIRRDVLKDAPSSILIVVEDVQSGTLQGINPAILDSHLQRNGFMIEETHCLYGKLANLERKLSYIYRVTNRNRSVTRGSWKTAILNCAARTMFGNVLIYKALNCITKYAIGEKGVDRMIKVCTPVRQGGR